MITAILASILGLSLGADERLEGRAVYPTGFATPCEMGPDFDASAHAFMRGFLTDTGLVGSVYASRRSELGIAGVSYAQVTIVQDTVKCRNAINIWKSHFATLSQEAGVKAAQFNSGMLFRITPNRFILATPMLNKYSYLTYIVLDSNLVVVRHNL